VEELVNLFNNFRGLVSGFNNLQQQTSLLEIMKGNEHQCVMSNLKI
jgi:hypothetical protein